MICSALQKFNHHCSGVSTFADAGGTFEAAQLSWGSTFVRELKLLVRLFKCDSETRKCKLKLSNVTLAGVSPH